MTEDMITENANVSDISEASKEEILSDPPKDVDISKDSPLQSDCDGPAENADADEGAPDVEALKQELEALRQKLDAKEREHERILHELGEFDRLFPETSVSSVPEEVWQKVDSGIPLCAAYALYERERKILSAHANEINLRNSSLSAGKAGKGVSEEYFSPDEVKHMSQKEVHENYSKIKNSMKYWR